MQWVETTGRTIEDAKEVALDQLGIDESEAEFEVLEEPKTGLFGRVRSEARVRARVVPKSPRPKQERKPRRPRAKSDDAGTASNTAGETAPQEETTAPKASERTPRSGGGRPPRQRAPKSQTSRSDGTPTKHEGSEMSDEAINVDQQADIITEFLEGLLESLSIAGTVDRTKIDDDTIELAVTSDSSDLGLLIGPKGQTLTAVHELSRTVLQRRATGRHDGRVRIDIGGYRHRRQEALARFVTQQASEVVASGVARALESMNAVDRKIVHDAVNEIDGVSTISEGVDPDRRVVLIPEATSE